MDIVLNDSDIKKRFAVELLKQPNEPYKAAVAAFGGDTGKAWAVYSHWKTDPEVLAYMEEATTEMGEMHFLPTKADLCRVAWDIANNQQVHVDDRLKAMRLYADIRGYIEKQGTVINNNVLTNNKVMVIKDHGSAADWEQRLAMQQQQLIDNANAPRTIN